MKKKMLFLVLLHLACLSVVAQVYVKKLSVENLTNPIAIDVLQPRFSWNIQSKERNLHQLAYQVLVASSPEKLKAETADIWDSGQVLSAASVLVPYTGRELSSRQRYFWKVRIWDQRNKASISDETAYFEMSLLTKNDWKGKWIGSPKVYDWAKFVAQRKLLIKKGEDDIFKAAPQFRKSFHIQKKVVKARFYVSGIGYHVPRLNGQKIGDHVLDPAFTRYDKSVLYTTYDVTEKLSKGENVLGIILGNGWYNMITKTVWGFDQAPWKNDPVLLAQLEIQYQDGTVEIIFSDESWKVAASPIIFNSIMQGETYDASLELTGWDKAGFDDKAWYEAVTMRGPEGVLKAQMIQPIKITEMVVPEKITEPQPGVYLFDLGKNIAGFARLKIEAPAGTEITLKYGERLLENGLVDHADIAQHVAGSYVHTDKYISKGKGIENWHPSFTYHGFQYVEVTGLPAKPDKETITGMIIHTALESAGSFKSSNDLLNAIQRNALSSYKSNFMGYPTDCPQREKNGWTGDAHLAAEMGLYNFKAQNAYTKWLEDIADEQRLSGELAAIVPSSGWGYFWGNGPAWDNAMVLIPWYMYQYGGDQRILEKMYPNIKRYVDYLSSRAANHIVRFGLGDWAPAKTKTPPEITSTAYYYVDAVLLSKMASLLGNVQDEKKYAHLAIQIKEAFNKNYYHGKGIYDQGSQTALACAIYQGLTDNSLRETVSSLVAAVKEKDDHLDCGMLGTKYLLHALSDNGRSDVAYQIVNQRTFPGWGNWIEQGATTLWEQWNGTESRNHIMFGDVSAWFYKNLAGIAPDIAQPGFKRISFHPYFPADLQWVQASHESMYGEILAGWKRKENAVHYSITIPGNTSGEIIMPKGKTLLLDGILLSKSKYASNVLELSDGVKFILGSGDYTITVK
ncbi:family 78 glycoside hydrolase catalytic domain [Daejeonella sp.]|uniref:alpha-L-rhamnosidase n=1 Tax=Daejeonella sp. TaxID=2805397 RepID=UPI0030C2D987